MAANKARVQILLEDGTDLADKINPRFLDLTLTEKRDEEADSLDLTLHNHDGKLAPVKAGQWLTVSLGWESGKDAAVGLVAKGRFKVDEVERSGPPDIVTIRARAADLTGDYKKRRTKAWKDTTVGAIINEIAGRNGWTPKVHADLSGKAITAIEQDGKSDMAFVRDLGKRFDAVATIKDKCLIFMPIGSETTASGKALAAITLTRKAGKGPAGRDGFKWTFRHAQRTETDGAEAQWHDQAEGKRKTVKTGGSTNGLGRKRLKKVYASEGDATQASTAEAKRSKRGAYEFDYDLAMGDPAIGPNQKVTLSGWDSEIDGIQWLTTEAVHKLGAEGLSTSLKLESAG